MRRSTYKKRAYIIVLLVSVLLLAQGCGKETEAQPVQVIGFDELDAEGLASWRQEQSYVDSDEEADGSEDVVDMDEPETGEEEGTGIGTEENETEAVDDIGDFNGISPADDEVLELPKEQTEQLYSDVLIDATINDVNNRVMYAETKAYLLKAEGNEYLLLATVSIYDFGEKLWLFRWEDDKAVEFRGFVKAALVDVESATSIEAQEIVNVATSMSWEEYSSTSTDYVFQRQFYKISGGELKTVPQTAEERIYETELHTYVARRFSNDETGAVIRWEIEVYNGDALLQTIRYGQDYAHPSWDGLIWEEDVNFDGEKDILILQGYYGSHGDKGYHCYCYNQRYSVYWEETSFMDIPNPEVDTERQLIKGSSRGGASTYTDVFYEYNGKEFVVVQNDFYVWNDENDEYELRESDKKEDCIFYGQLISVKGLSEEDRLELERFAAVFDDDTELYLWTEAEIYEGTMPLHQVQTYYGIDMPGFMELNKFVLVDVTGDGKKELIMELNDMGGCVLVICEENGEFYMSYQGIRHIVRVYEDGLLMGTSAASVYSFHRLSFDNRAFGDEIIAHYDVDYLGVDESVIRTDCLINNEPVTLEEFIAWENANVGNEVIWYKLGR